MSRKLKNIYTFGGEPAQRNWTVGDLMAYKQQGENRTQLTQVTAIDRDEAQAAEAVGIDLISITACDLPMLRDAAPKTFMHAALPLTDYLTEKDVIEGAVTAMHQGADAVFTSRSLRIINILAEMNFPVMGHLGLVPRHSTWIGGLRAVGNTAQEALQLYRQFKRLEDAGAFSVEVEVVPEEVLREINKRTTLVTISIGAGPGGDVAFLFTNDICGDTENPPRHVKSYGNLLALKEQIKQERLRALTAFKQDVTDGGFPEPAQAVSMKPQELEKFLDGLEKLK